MVENALARRLHDKRTRGGALTEAERAQLEAWYEQQDNEEEALLSSAPQAPATLRTLRGEVDVALSRLSAVTQRIRTLTDENEALRRDIAALHQQLAQASAATPQAA